MPRKKRHRRRMRGFGWFGCPRQACPRDLSKNTLHTVQPGKKAWICGFLAGISHQQKAHLQAYGLQSGQWVTVLQQSPVTVVQVDQLELAMEKELAEKIQVGEVSE